MLQPRISACGKMEGTRIWSFFVLAALCTLATCQGTKEKLTLVIKNHLNDEEIIESSRIKREGVPENRDLTVLLVNQKNEYNSRIGRYHQVKPLIGLLTATTRTFIQDGVTTEFATQILGTTLDNGRIYAQLLTKSSLVLYSKQANADDPVVVRPTRIHSDFDGQWNVKQDLGFIDPEKFVLKNIDYLAPSSSLVSAVYPSKHPQDSFQPWSQPSQFDNNQINEEPVGRRVQQFKEIPRYIQNEVDGPVIENEKKLEYIVEPSTVQNQNVNSLHRQSKAFEPIVETVKDSEEKDLPIEPSVVKVKPDYELPTFTIKNEFSPIFYYIDNVESKRVQPQLPQQMKTPKKLFGQKSEPRPKKTFTYEGFADFTTVVGDTVIIFTPNTNIPHPQNPEEVNVFPSAMRADKLGSKITFLSADIPLATATYKAHEETPASAIPTPASVEEKRFKDKDDIIERLKQAEYELDDTVPYSVSEPKWEDIRNNFDLNMDVIQPSESPVSTTENTRLTDDLGVLPIQEYSPQATPMLKDPLINVSPTNIIIEKVSESAVTEDMTELFTNSEEENENTASEITEKPEEEEEEEEEDEYTTQEIETGIATTTESGHSEESSEELETTTESKIYVQHDTEHDFHEDVVCTDGLETQYTMTTEYKTLTYLTTYFIPLESTETTTSIKSDVVVESNVGYLTNVVCKTEFIEPTAVVSVDVNYSVHSNKKTPEIVSEEPVTTPPVVTEIPTEQSKTTELESEITTLQQEKSVESDHTDIEVNEKSEEITEEKEPTTSTTTERSTTTQSHVEVSVSTEQTTTTTENIITEEEESENEIDVIYKTLYTTYTYFTTFFGESTSSVINHKSVVTNILTSTIDLSKLDPSLLGAFNEDEIAPSNVGIGRPTELYVNSVIDLVKNKDVIESVEAVESYSAQTPTPSLGDDVIANIKPDAVKTYFTTYTFFTTIYVGSDANVCSRSEVYTNYVGPEELIPTKTNPLIESSKVQFDFRNCKQVKREQPADPEAEDSSSMVTSVSMQQSSEQAVKVKEVVKEESEEIPQPTPIEVDMLFSVDSNPIESENSYVTDVKSSSSKGERQYLDSNNILDDQISSESNIDEIMPSPTLLLQTSYTTFTYFTTMYIGKDSSKVKSHLETITNVVTETIMPNKEPEDESNLPITYYTTFTYWTTLYKDKSTTITSREEIVSNVVIPSVQLVPSISPIETTPIDTTPIDTTPIDIDSVLPPKDLEVEIKPSLIDYNLEADDGKATFYTTYTYFTTFYAGNTSQIRSSLETVTNIVENSKIVEDNQIARKVPSGSGGKNLIQDNGEKLLIVPTVVKEAIISTKLPDISSASPTVLLGTYIDNLFAEVNPASPEPEKKILFSQVAVISGDSKVVTSDNKTLDTESVTPVPTTSTTDESNISPTPKVIESSEAEPEPTTEKFDDDDATNKKKSRLTFTPKKPSVIPVIIPFASRNRPTFVPKRVPSASGAITVSRQDATPTITATPTLKAASRPSSFNGNRKINAAAPGPNSGKRVFGRNGVSNPSANVPVASRVGNNGRGAIQPASKRTGFRSSSLKSNSADYISRSAVPRIRPSASSRLQFGRSSIRPSASITFPPQNQSDDGETYGTQQDETATEPFDEASEAPSRTTNNPLFRFRRPPVARQPGTPFVPRSTTSSSRRPAVSPRGRLTTTTRKVTTRATTNPLLSLRRQKTNALFPRRNLFKQPEPEPEEELLEEEEEILEGEEFEEDNDYDSSDRKSRQVETPSTAAPKKSNIVQIRPFGFRRRSKRQVDYGSRKYTNFRRPGLKSTRKPDPEPETEAPSTQRQTTRTGRYNPRLAANTRTTTAKSVAQKASPRQSFIVRGESRTTTSAPAYRRGKPSRTSARTTTTASRPKAPRLSNSRVAKPRPSTSRNTRTRTTTSRASSRQRNSYENHSGERFNNHNKILNDGKITITHQIPTEVTIPIYNGKFTEYKHVLSATPRIDILNLNQVATAIGPLGQPQLVLIDESTDLAENGATKIIKYILHETPTTTAIFTPTTIRGRKTSFAHIIPSTIYNVEAVTQTLAPEINSNVPLANLLLSQLLLGNQQPAAINPLLALQGQGLIPQQQVAPTPVTEYKTRMTTYVTTVIDNRETVLSITFKAFNQDTIVYDNTPWRPGRDLEPVEKSGVEDERKLKNVATRIMSNGVEVLVKDKGEGKLEQRKLKVMHLPSMKPSHTSSSSSPKRSLLSSAVATVVNHQLISALFPLHQLMQHNYIIKTCMTTYTYLTTVVQNKRSAISTFETIVSVVTTESISNYPDVLADLKPTKTKYMEVKTIKPSAPINMYASDFAKIDKRIDSADVGNGFELIQSSEANHIPCSGYSCSDIKTETLKTKYTNIDASAINMKYALKSSKLKLDVKPTNKDDKKTQYPYKFESSSHEAPTDKLVEKYTEVMNDYSEEKDNNSVEESELLTNEQAPAATKKVATNKIDKFQEKKPEKIQKINKSKFQVADLLKLGTLGIKGLTQLAPVIEKMTGCFTKKQAEIAAGKTTSTTIKPAEDLVAYSSNKRIDNILESKQGTFPIYIPVDELETSESQTIFTNATLHQNLAWAAEHKQMKSHLHPHKMIHESPLVNGGIPISPGEIITANSDVIVGKPAVGGPLTLAASGIKLHNPVNPPPLDSFVAANEQYSVNERPLGDQSYSDKKVDDSFDLRPPSLPKSKPNRPQNIQRPMNNDNFSKYPYRMPNAPKDDEPKKPPKSSNHNPVNNHGRPVFLDYIPSLASFATNNVKHHGDSFSANNAPSKHHAVSFNMNNAPNKHHINFKPTQESKKEIEIPDNSPSSSEIVNTHIKTDEEYTITGDPDSNQPFLVDIQPSRVANVLIPHGSSTALVFAGSSEPHKTGDYVDDPLPYPEPGYFGSFSIDAPKMTNVHNVAPNNKPYSNKLHIQSSLESYKPNQYKEQAFRNDQKFKWQDNKRPLDFSKIPPPTSNQETHAQIGPQITVYNPDVYNPSNGDFEKYNQVKQNNKNKGKEVIDKEYENYLAVPPPPPKMLYNDNKNKPYNQRPIVQTKPVQDMSVLLNIQHPVPKEQHLPKVTSEIYFAAQAPTNKHTPTYTIHMPPTSPTYSFNKHHNNIQPPKTVNTGSSQGHLYAHHSTENLNNKSNIALDNDKDGNTYTVTLNTATNVGSNVNDDKQVVGSSVPVEIGNSQMNADIPIGTNFAIRVEDNNTPLESYNIQGNRNPQIIYDYNGRVHDVSIGDNRWNKSSIETNENTIVGHNYRDRPVHINEVKPPTTSTVYENTIIGQSYAERPNQNNARPSLAPGYENTVIGLNYGERPAQEYAPKPSPPTNNKNTLIGLNYGEIQGEDNAVRPSTQQHESTHTGLNFGKRPFQEHTPRPHPSVNFSERPNQGTTRPSHPPKDDDINIGLNYGERPVQEYAPRPLPPTHYENTIIGQSYSDIPRPINSVRPLNSYTVRPIPPPSTNSHANFPMMNEDNIGSHTNDNVKPVTEKVNDSKRPGKLIPNLPTNSHGWYSSIVIDENNVKNIDTKTESTTRKVIPLQHDGKDKLPNFGQKITSAGKPPSEFWTQNQPQIVSSFNVGRPFTKPSATEKPASMKPFTFKPYKHNYIPNLGEVNQPAYDIPIRDNSAETSTHGVVKPSVEKVKPVYENAEEIYDGEDELENTGEVEGEVSSESMKVPVISASNEVASNESPSKPSTELSLLQDEVLPQANTQKPQPEKKKPANFNSGSQTEKPFGSFNKSSTFQSNAIKPIYDSNSYMKPRPFTVGTAPVLDHQLQQPHWQINQLMENSTNNMSYEDNLELNTGEEMNANSPVKSQSTQKPYNGYPTESYSKYNNPPRPVYSARPNNSFSEDPNIITSTVHIKDKKPLIVEKQSEKTTLPSFTINSEIEINRTSSEIIDLSPPPPTMDYNFKPSTNDEMIMGMSPPPPRNRAPVRQPPRIPLTPKPIPVRTPPQHLNKPPRTLPPRLPQQRPTRKPINRDEVSTYRPAYDILNNIRRPTYNRDQPSSQLLPPPREVQSRPDNSNSDIVASVNAPAASNIVFPTPISSGWLTSSGVEFSSSFNFGPGPVPYAETPKPSRLPESFEPSHDNSYSYDNEHSSEHVDEGSSEKPLTDDTLSSSKESSTESVKVSSFSKETNINDSLADESSQEQATTDRMKVVPLGNKIRTRKPYPFRNEGKNSSINKYKLPPRPTAIVRPTRTLNRPEILYPTRHTSIKKIVRPIPSKSHVVTPSIIESSESSVDEEFIKPTEVLKMNLLPTILQHEDIPSDQKESATNVTPNLDDVIAIPPQIHHGGNEVKISDEIIPTKTEFKTTVITHTKILSEPPLTVSNVDYVNLTHTMTVTHTETSLVTQLEGTVTQTFVLTNTYISTIVDVVTEIQVQPTTIIETVTRHIPVQVEPTSVQNIPSNTKIALDDITMSSEEEDNLIIRDSDTTENVLKIDTEGDGDNDTFFVVMNKSQNGGQTPPISNDIETGEYDVTRNEQVNNNGVSQVLFGEILLAGTPYLETTNVHSSGFGKECQPDCKASRNERCQRIDGIMKCVCRPGFARMFPDRPCKPTYTYSVKLALGTQGSDRLLFQESLADNSSKHYQALAFATHEGINRMVMQSDLRDVYHGVHITGFHPVQMKDDNGDDYQGVMNDFYVQLSDNAHESRLKEVIEKYLRNNNYSLGGTDVHAAGELVDRLDVSDFNECTSGQFHDCSEHAQCFNLRGTYTCSCLEGFADLSVNNLYPGRICSAEPVGCERCNYHGSCYSRDDQRVLCECFQWYAGSTCQVNLKVVLISLVVLGALLTVVLAACAVVACSKKQPRPPKRSIVACIQSMPSLHQGAAPPKQRQDRRALINERGDSGDASSIQNASLPYMPAKRASSKQCVISAPPAHDPPPPPAPAVLIPRARLLAHDQLSRRRSTEVSEAKLISYLESGVSSGNEEMRRKHSLESSYSANKERHCKQGALVSAGYKVSTTIRPDEAVMKEERDDLSSVNKADLEDMGRFDSLRKSYSQEDLSEWTDAERRMGELTLSEARSVGGTLPASTGRAASSTRLTHQEANTMAERDLGSTFLLPHVHLYRPDLTSDVSEFDSL